MIQNTYEHSIIYYCYSVPEVTQTILSDGKSQEKILQERYSNNFAY